MEISHNNIMSEFQINIIYIITYYIKKISLGWQYHQVFGFLQCVVQGVFSAVSTFVVDFIPLI